MRLYDWNHVTLYDRIVQFPYMETGSHIVRCRELGAPWNHVIPGLQVLIPDDKIPEVKRPEGIKPQS